MKLSPSQLPISNVLTFFAVATVMILVSVFSGTLYFLIGPTVKNLQGQIVQQAAENVSDSIYLFLSFHREALKKIAQQPVTVQSIIQPAQMRSQLTSALLKPPLPSTKGQLTLLDHEGGIINASTPQPAFDYTRKNWVTQLIDRTIDHYWEVSSGSDGTRYWRIATPVVFNGQRQGVLVAEIELSAVNTFQRNNKFPQQMEIELIQHGESVATFGRQISSPTYLHSMEDPRLTISCRMDTAELKQTWIAFVSRIGLVLLATVLILMGASLYFASRLCVKPLQDLRQRMPKVSNDLNHQFLPTNQALLEISALTAGYNWLIEQIRCREKALLEANTHLESRIVERTQRLHNNQEKLRILNKRLTKQLVARTVELEAARDSLIMQEKMASVGRLSAGLAHELNSSLNFVRTKFATLAEDFFDLLLIYSQYEVLTRKASENPLLAERAAEVQLMREKLGIGYLLDDIPPLFDESARGLARIAKIIQCLRNFSSPGMGDDLIWANINTGIEDALIIARNEYKHYAEVQITFGTVSDIRCSPEQLSQVFLNLIVNSADAIASQNREDMGLISIRTWQEGDTVLCELRDDGPGIPPEYRCRIFEPFFTTKVPGKRIGLGLSISYDIIVHKHRGQIYLRCPDDGGVIFTIALPLDLNEEVGTHGSR